VPAPSDEGKSWLLFARAKAAGDLGHFEKASKLYRSANELMRVRSRFDFAGHGQMLQGMKIGFSGMAPPPASVGSDHHPIMILGASRAGKSLVERLLADGRDAVAFGEHLTWQGALAAAGVGEVALRPLLPEVGAKVAAAYLSKVTARAPEAKVSLGTSPGNLMFAGMFLEALPEGRVVWVRRALRDQVLRIYFKRYNAGNGFAYDFGDITRFLAQFDDMMTHWKMRYGARVIEVRYEDLVTDAAAALAPLGLPVRDLRLSADEIGRWRDYAPFWSDFATLGVA